MVCDSNSRTIRKDRGRPATRPRSPDISPPLQRSSSLERRRREIHRPLFPGYTFLRAAISAEIKSLVLRSAGVADFVHAMGKPLAIVDREIADIQALAARQIPFSPCPFVNIGTRVQVRGGALDGLVGILVGRNSDCSLVISVELIQRSVALRVQGYAVVPV